MMKVKLFITYLFIAGFSISHAQDLTGTWYGKTETEEPRHYILDLRKSEQGLYGLLDVPAENFFRFRLDSIAVTKAGEVYLKQQGLAFEFRGNLDEALPGIEGTLLQDSITQPLLWSKIPQAERTQPVGSPASYVVEDVTFVNTEENIELAGTLTLPDSPVPALAVVLISGSGPQNRDEEVLGHKPFLVLADHLTRHGIAVLRYDDRGTGQSGGKFRPATSADYAGDALAAVDFLKKDPRIDADQIGLIGHSEGGNIAPMAAVRDPEIAFLVLLAAPGVANIDMYLVQLDDIYREESPEVRERDIPFWTTVYKSMAEIGDKQVLRDTLGVLFEDWLQQLPEEELALAGDVERYKQQEITRHTSDWYHYFLQFDVAEYLEQLTIPVLALNGDKDLQVDAKQNLAGIRRILEAKAHSDFKTVELEGVNHFFQPCQVGDYQEIYFLKETFSPLALREIHSWIWEITGRAR